jgi:hypothetical protein
MVRVMINEKHLKCPIAFAVSKIQDFNIICPYKFFLIKNLKNYESIWYR